MTVTPKAALMQKAQSPSEKLPHTETVEIGDMVVQVSGAGTPLVFVHGFTTTAEFWREQTSAFSSRYNVIRINLPGHGISPHPKGRSYTISSFVEDVLQVYRALDIGTSVFVGLSMGGTVAQNFALSHPELVGALVLVGATPHGLGSDRDSDYVLQAIDDLGVIVASQRVIERSFGSAAAADLVAFARDEVAQTPAFVAREAIVSFGESDTRGRLREIKAPTLVIVGDEDNITPPRESRILAQGIPHARLEVVPGAAHFPMLEQPEIFNQLLRDFLEEQEGSFSTARHIVG
jgi:3-oxoadipate enol-lactonase